MQEEQWVVRPIANRLPTIYFASLAFLIIHTYIHASVALNYDFRPVLVKFGEYDVTRHRDCKDGVCMSPTQILKGRRILLHPDF